ncbi:MAG TPA: OsmC family protein [Polyangiaceae bacterium]|nr:OsmC family protein [Polyangiaceae bacterium]
MNAPAQKQSLDTLNGLPLAELAQVPAALSEAPERGLLTFETRTTWRGGLRSRSEVEAYEAGGERIVRHHRVEADEPEQIFGTDTAPNPQELFFSAIGSCISAMYVVHATLMGIELRSLQIALRGTLDMRGTLGLADVPPGFPEVSCRVHVSADATPERIQTLHAAVLALSPNYYHLTRAIPARTQLVIGS